jgi:hypothetical protein
MSQAMYDDDDRALVQIDLAKELLSAYFFGKQTSMLTMMNEQV